MSGNSTGKRAQQSAHAAAALRGLARAFSYPDAAWVETLLDGQWPAALAAVVEPLGLSATKLHRAIGALPGDPAAALRVLEVEYTYLFINAVPHLPVPPYASAYAGQGLLMGEPAESALVAYRQAGLTLAEGYRDLPDHVAAELEFLAWLGEQAQAAFDAGDEALARSCLAHQQAFLERQMQPWLPRFCQRVIDAARLPFYRELARLALALLSATPALQHADSTGGN